MKKKDEIYPWFFLDYDGIEIKKKVTYTWMELLKMKNLAEEDYHRFVSNLPRFFFTHDFESEFVAINKLKLGSDYVTDLVLGLDTRSRGFTYRLIEFESPHDKIYTKGGKPSAKLATAIQQIQDWKMWISENMEYAKKIRSY